MKTKRFISYSTSIAILVLCLASAQVAAEQGTKHWSYAGEDGPEHWGELSADFHMCRDGQNQSPINLQHNIDAELAELVFEYYSSPGEATNNGHSIQIDVEAGSFLKIPSLDRSFELKQFHFHSPSEHTIEGQSYAMEMHFVHADENGALAVVGVMINVGQENPVLKEMRYFMPEQSGENEKAPIGIEETDLLPPTRDYYYYSGSLTTPPCSEGVAWIVLKDPIEASLEQIARFKEQVGATTNRPVQPHNARMILD